ncbi:MAG: hypothetical protein LBR69_03010 [Endomicrobium sp.]|jgi:hypothetical protein|nr:hypothetical protein [Endomicrobium sp.]
MTGAELYRKINSKFKRDDKEQETYDAINDTIAKMVLAHRFSEIENTQRELSIMPGNFKFKLSDDFVQPVGDVILLNGINQYFPLCKVTKDNFDFLYPNIENLDVQPSMPQHYCIFGGYVQVGPRPDKDYRYKLSYTKSPVIVDKTTQNVPLSKYYLTIIDGALSELSYGVDEADKGQIYAIKYEQSLSAAIADDLKSTDAVRFVRPINF